MKSHTLSSVGTAVLLALPDQPDIGSLMAIIPAATSTVLEGFHAIVVIGDKAMFSLAEAVAGMGLIVVNADHKIIRVSGLEEVNLEQLLREARDVMFIGSAADMEMVMRIRFGRAETLGGPEAVKFDDGCHAKSISYEFHADRTWPLQMKEGREEMALAA